MRVHAHFCSLHRIYQVPFNATHQVKAIVIGIIEANPLARWLILIFLFIHFTHTYPSPIQYLIHSKLKELLPHTYFYNIWLSISKLQQIGNHAFITFTRPVFMFKIDHDDDTVKRIFSHLLARYEPYISIRISSIDIGCMHCTCCIDCQHISCIHDCFPRPTL